MKNDNYFFPIKMVALKNPMWHIYNFLPDENYA